MAVFQVELKKVVDDSYPIEIGEKLAGRLIEDIRSGLLGEGKKLAVITDDRVEELYAAEILRGLQDAGYAAESFVIPAGEKSKTRRMKERLEDAMIAAGYRRDCAVIAVGGGVVSDLAGFLAGTYARGVPFVIYATTLLSAADASIGGKTAVDTPAATNLIGLFHQPKKVYIDLNAWNTLPGRQICSGLAETIKHACMADADFFVWLEENIRRVRALDPDACAYIAQKNCAIKYRVVMQDEREDGMREILNLGHTVGRAIETVSDYRLLHGEAVAIGLSAQAKLAERLGLMRTEETCRLAALLQAAGLPTAIPAYIDREELVRKLYTDKKVRGGRLRFVLQQGIGAIACRECTGPAAKRNYAYEISEEQAREVIRAMP